MSASYVVYEVPYASISVNNAAAFRTEFLEVICNSSRPVIVDMSGVQFIDSYGLGILVLAARVIPQHARMVFIWADEKIRSICDLVGIGGVLSSATSVEEAVRMISAQLDDRPSRDELSLPLPG